MSIEYATVWLYRGQPQVTFWTDEVVPKKVMPSRLGVLVKEGDDIRFIKDKPNEPSEATGGYSDLGSEEEDSDKGWHRPPG